MKTVEHKSFQWETPHGTLRLGDEPEMAAWIDAALKDAERYRWLRDGCNDKLSPATHIAANRYGLEWDAAIDAALQAKEQG